ncbi:MAG: CPBP family glutamic-type intramembrane protease, partial [Chloroflexota bacterium]
SFFGVKYGWGIVIASVLFGVTHVGLLSMLLGESSSLTWAWGFWTFFGGLVFGLVREKSGSIVAPALLHGLPQAIASGVILFM